MNKDSLVLCVMLKHAACTPNLAFPQQSNKESCSGQFKLLAVSNITSSFRKLKKKY